MQVAFCTCLGGSLAVMWKSQPCMSSGLQGSMAGTTFSGGLSLLRLEFLLEENVSLSLLERFSRHGFW